MPADEADRHFRRLRRRGGIAGQRVRLLRRRRPGILEHAGLDRPAEEILVDRERRRLRGLNGDSLVERVLDLLVARPDPVAERGDHVEAGIGRLERKLEAQLVVPLAGAAVHDSLGAELDRELGHRLRDHRARERGDEWVLALVERVRLDRARTLLLGERGLAVDEDDVVGARGAPTFDRRLEVELLADVDEDSDDLVEAVPVLLEPADDATRVEAAGEGDHRDPAHLAPSVECILFTIAGFHAAIGWFRADPLRRLPAARRISRGPCPRRRSCRSRERADRRRRRRSPPAPERRDVRRLGFGGRGRAGHARRRLRRRHRLGCPALVAAAPLRPRRGRRDPARGVARPARRGRRRDRAGDLRPAGAHRRHRRRRRAPRAARGRVADARRRPGAGALARRDGADRPGRGPHPGREEPLLPRRVAAARRPTGRARTSSSTAAPALRPAPFCTSSISPDATTHASIPARSASGTRSGRSNATESFGELVRAMG